MLVGSSASDGIGCVMVIWTAPAVMTRVRIPAKSAVAKDSLHALTSPAFLTTSGVINSQNVLMDQMRLTVVS